jgi:uncharacterized protein (TIGR02594 family)
MTDFSTAPAWFQAALIELGTHEQGDNAGAAVQRYCNLAHCGAQGMPWCAIFANAMLESCGVSGTRSPGSRSFTNSANFVKMAQPALGAIAVFWRGKSPADGIGHVGFYRGELNGEIYVLGGNEGDEVQIEPLPAKSANFGLLGYYWPEAIPMPIDLGPVIMPAGTPQHETDAGKVT